ncbi:putative porin [Alcanivorax sp. 1008]|uniref:putative porin n=1 Tax=Alcanivorax sp. 1008 TaxID=2816853 RepID=UPI001D9573D7|nr:putative porin [Alcanivorax sp. 1008]MCC1495620.1 putative porin [Alcanivorax sp. 1008]
MKKTYLAAAIAAAFSVAGAAQAQDYQMEAGLNYFDDGNTVSDMAVDFTYHIDTVTTADRPLAEAAFLGRNSNISAFYYTPDDDTLEDTMGLGVEWWFEDIYAAADVSDNDGDKDMTLRLGYMLQDGFLIYAGYNDDDAAALSTILLGTKYVADSLNVEVEVSQSDDVNDTVAVSALADYYINNSFSVGASVDKAERGASTFGVQSRYFFTPVFSGEVGYEKTESNPDDLISARVAYRF